MVVVLMSTCSGRLWLRSPRCGTIDRCRRRGPPRDGQHAGGAAAAILPFFAYYAARGFLAIRCGKIRGSRSARAVRRRLDISTWCFARHGGLDCRLLGDSLVRQADERRAQSPYWRLLIVAADASWIFIGLYALGVWKKDLITWIGAGSMLQSLKSPARHDGAGGGRPRPLNTAPRRCSSSCSGCFSMRSCRWFGWSWRRSSWLRTVCGSPPTAARDIARRRGENGSVLRKAFCRRLPLALPADLDLPRADLEHRRRPSLRPLPNRLSRASACIGAWPWKRGQPPSASTIRDMAGHRQRAGRVHRAERLLPGIPARRLTMPAAVGLEHAVADQRTTRPAGGDDLNMGQVAALRRR